MSPLAAFYLAFAVDYWTTLYGKAPPRWVERDMRWVCADIADHTGAAPLEGLTLVDIATWESGFRRDALGKLGERGPFQQLGGPYDAAHPAREALARLRRQKIWGFMGCPQGIERCERMAEVRTLPAKVYFWSHE